MEIKIVATDQLTELEGVQVRVWDGTTAQGTRCKVFVRRIAVHQDQDSSQFDRELNKMLPPGRAVPLWQVL